MAVPVHRFMCNNLNICVRCKLFSCCLRRRLYEWVWENIRLHICLAVCKTDCIDAWKCVVMSACIYNNVQTCDFIQVFMSVRVSMCVCMNTSQCLSEFYNIKSMSSQIYGWLHIGWCCICLWVCDLWVCSNKCGWVYVRFLCCYLHILLNLILQEWLREAFTAI